MFLFLFCFFLSWHEVSSVNNFPLQGRTEARFQIAANQGTGSHLQILRSIESGCQHNLLRTEAASKTTEEIFGSHERRFVSNLTVEGEDSIMFDVAEIPSHHARSD